jgi:hypothetical protein
VSTCQDHNMPGCDTCTGLYTACPDTLASLSQVCLAHHMQECQPFYDMCAAAGQDLASFCNAKQASYDPPMRMYFHGGATHSQQSYVGLCLRYIYG